MQQFFIRKISLQDLGDLKKIIASTELFPEDLLDDMTNDYFTNQTTTDCWYTLLLNDQPIAIAYYAPERLTEGTHNLYLIAVHKQFQNQGIGKALLEYIEQSLKIAGQRILIVETSGLPEFERTRNFYSKQQYYREAQIRDFYREGEDKIIFWKKL